MSVAEPPPLRKRDVRGIALDFAQICASVGVRCAFIGGMAVNAWGEPRATLDVDVILDLEPTPAFAAKLVTALKRGGFSARPEDLLEARVRGGHATIFDDRSVFHVDAVFARDALEREQIVRAVPVAVRPSGASIPVVAPEETLAFKLKFGSPQDLADARAILQRQQDVLDHERLDAVALGLGVSKELADLRRALGPARGR